MKHIISHAALFYRWVERMMSHPVAYGLACLTCLGMLAFLVILFAAATPN